MSREVAESGKHVFYFFKGFLITYGVMIISYTIFLIIDYLYLCPSFAHTLPLIFLPIACGDLIFIISTLSLVLLGILVILHEGFARNKNPYTWMGKIGAIFGLLFLIIKRNEGEPLDLYMEHPKKKKNHFLYGFLLSIGFLILYLPLMLFGLVAARVFDFWALVVVFIILLNIFTGVPIFFFKEKLRYISIGMIPLLLFGILLDLRWILYFLDII